VNADPFGGRRVAPLRTEMIRVKASRTHRRRDSFSRGSSPPARWPATPAKPAEWRRSVPLCLCGSVR